MTKPYRVGIIGCGGMSRNHAKAYAQNPETTLVAAMDISRESAAKLSQEYSVPAVYTDYNELLEKEDLDIVSIATWQGVRAEITIAAAKAGVKGILGEKPMAACLGEADDMIEAYAKSMGRNLPSGIKAVTRRKTPKSEGLSKTVLSENQPCFMDALSLAQGCLISVRTSLIALGTNYQTRKRCGSLAKRRARPTSGNGAPVVKICAWGSSALKAVQGQYTRAICPNPLSPDRPFTALPGK